MFPMPNPDSSPNTVTPSTQKAWVVTNRGTPQTALTFKTDYAVPKLKCGDVLVKVKVAALNPVGWKLMSALPNMLSPRPHPAEHDFAGVVVDPNGEKFEVGEEVLGWIPVPLQFRTRQGALAQYVSVPATHLVPKPPSLNWEEAGGLALAGLTAVQGLRLGGYDITRFLQSQSQSSSPTQTTTQPQETIFINGGSTTVGIYAIQIAKAMNLLVTATASTRNHPLLRSLGADDVIDYTASPLPAYLSSHPPDPKFGMIFDAVGLLDTELYEKSEGYLKEGGVYVSTGPWPDAKGGWLGMVGKVGWTVGRPGLLGGVRRSWKLVGVQNEQADLKALCTLIEKGGLRPRVDSSFEFEDALSAYEKLLTGRATGKVVVKVD